MLLLIHQQPMAMAINHRASVRVLPSVPAVALFKATAVIAMAQHDSTAGQINGGLAGQCFQQMLLAIAPTLLRVIIAPNSDHLIARLEGQKHIRATDVTGVNSDIAGANAFGDARVQKAMRIR